MSDSDDRVGRIGAALDAAVAALSELPEEARSEYPDGFVRVENALGFARVCLDSTDPQLVSESAETSLIDEATSIATNAVEAYEPAYADDLISATLLLPAAHGRDVEQTAKDAAATYQRAMASRIRPLEEQIAAARETLTAIQEDSASASAEATAEITAQSATLQTKIDALEAAIGAQQATLDAQLTRHTTAFSTSQGENAEKFQSELMRFNTELEEQFKQASVQIEGEAEKVRTIAKDVGVLSGAIALKETAEHYGLEAEAQSDIANRWRSITIVVTLGAVAMAVWAVVKDADDRNTLIAKLAASAILGGLATYTATQSGRHRAREVKAEDLQLQLTAFSPFVAPLLPELQQVERVRVSRSMFGQSAEIFEEDEHTGPGLLAYVRKLLQVDEPPEPPAP